MTKTLAGSPMHQCATSRVLTKLGWDRDDLDLDSVIQDMITDLMHLYATITDELVSNNPELGLDTNNSVHDMVRHATNQFIREYSEPDELAMSHECHYCNGSYLAEYEVVHDEPVA